MHGPTIGELGASAAQTVANTHVPSGSDCEFALYLILAILLAILVYVGLASLWMWAVGIDLSRVDLGTRIMSFVLLPVMCIEAPIIGIVLGIQNAQDSRHWSGTIGYSLGVLACIAILVVPLVLGHLSRVKRMKDVRVES